jgi:biopolymer transport protein ExbD
MVRLLLVLLVIFLIARLFVVYGSVVSTDQKKAEPEDNNAKSRKGVPKGVGEYIDYEEVKK